MEDYSRIFDLNGRRALVIGGGSGIGRAGCLGLASFGAHVICGDVEMGRAREAAQAIGADGRRGEALHIDLCDGASVAAAAKQVGVPDVLVISPSINVRKPLLDITEDEFDRIVGLNLKGIFRALKASCPAWSSAAKAASSSFPAFARRSSSRAKACMRRPRRARCR